MGHATVVMFSPEDLRIVRTARRARRRFVDMQLSQIRPGYVRALKNYLSVLESRNALLRQDKLAGASAILPISWTHGTSSWPTPPCPLCAAAAGFCGS